LSGGGYDADSQCHLRSGSGDPPARESDDACGYGMPGGGTDTDDRCGSAYPGGGTYGDEA
jgi:hypothetical protein